VSAAIREDAILRHQQEKPPLLHTKNTNDWHRIRAGVSRARVWDTAAARWVLVRLTPLDEEVSGV
jgi:hypothetical protein